MTIKRDEILQSIKPFVLNWIEKRVTARTSSPGGSPSNTQLTDTQMISLAGAAYASATSITITGDWTTKLFKGSPFKYVQASGTKYAYGIGYSYNGATGLTTCTLTGGSDFTVANQTITECYVGVGGIGRPDGFPEWFNYTPTWASASNPQPVKNNGTLEGQFKMDGSTLTLRLRLVIGSTTTLGTGAWSFTLPVAASASATYNLGWGYYRRPSTFNYQFMVQVPASATVLTYFLPSDQAGVDVNNLTPTVPVAWVSGDWIYVDIRYRI